MKMKLILIFCISFYSMVLFGQKRLIRSEFGQAKVLDSSIEGKDEKILFKDIISKPVCIKIDRINNKIYWSNEGSQALNRCNFDGSNVETISNNSIAIQTIDFDYKNGRIYWGDINVAKILSTNFDGSNQKSIYQNNDGGGVYGLVLLPENNIMYFTTGNSIYSSKLDGSGVKEILTNLDSPRNLILDTKKNEFYWEERPFIRTGNIKKSNIDGTNIQTVINTNSDSPQGFQIDFDELKIYWINGKDSKLYKANLDGTNQELAVELSPGGTSLIASLQLGGNKNEVFWSNYVKNNIQKTNIVSSETEIIIEDFLDNPYEIIVDNIHKNVFVTDYNNGILKSNYEGNEIEFVVKSSYIQGIAVDSNFLYYYDNSKKEIVKANLDGSNKTTLFSKVGFVKDIELDKKKNQIYWIDGTDRKIYKSNLDGIDKQAIIDAGSNAWSLAIDEKNEKIFWSNRSIAKGEIMRSNLDGSNIETLTKGNSQYLGWIKINKSKDEIYWTENTINSSLYKINIDGTNQQLVLGMKSQLRGFDFIYETDYDSDGFSSEEDCDDNNPNINPGKLEIPYNGLDDDCNPITLDDDLDQDGFVLANDCNDNNPEINPSKPEIPYNGLDDDCNPISLDDDFDQDGFVLANDCDDNNPNINPNAIDIPDNGIDENCDGKDATISSANEFGKSTINVYPNPVSSELIINVQGMQKYSTKLYDSKGIILFLANNISNIKVNELTNGIYFLEIKDINSDDKFVQKIIVQK